MPAVDIEFFNPIVMEMRHRDETEGPLKIDVEPSSNALLAGTVLATIAERDRACGAESPLTLVLDRVSRLAAAVGAESEDVSLALGDLIVTCARWDAVVNPPTGDKVRQAATEDDAALIAKVVARYGSQLDAAKALHVSQPRLSRASIPGKGRALSARLRAILTVAVTQEGT